MLHPTGCATNSSLHHFIQTGCPISFASISFFADIFISPERSYPYGLEGDAKSRHCCSGNRHKVALDLAVNFVHQKEYPLLPPYHPGV